MIKLFTSFFILLVATSLSAQSISEGVIWTEYYANYQFDKKIGIEGAIQYRPFTDRERFYQMVYGLSASYKPNPGVTYTIGSEALIIHTLQLDSVRLNLPIYQPHQSVQLIFPLGKARFRWRFRLEERFFQEASECLCTLTNSYLFAFRFRLLSEVFIPIAKDWEIQTGIEPMLQAGDWIQSSFDQNRTLLLLRRKIGKVTLRAGYMHWLFKTQSGVFENRHTFRLGMIHALN
jgi:hypothetical protein